MKLGCVPATGEHLFPIHSGFLAEDTREEEDKEALKRVEDSEKSLEGFLKSRCREDEENK